MRASRIPDSFNTNSPLFETNKPLKNLKPNSVSHLLINFLCSPSDTLLIFNAQALLCITGYYHTPDQQTLEADT